MKIRKLALTALCLTLAFSLPFASSCAKQEAAAAETDNKTIVAVTILPQKAFVEAVCGDLAEVISVVPPGYSPENFEPTPQQRETFSKASVYFTIGVPAEKTILPGLTNMNIVDLAEKVAAAYPDREFAPGSRDPHIWLSPKRAKVMVETIASAMSALDAKNAQTYKENAKGYLKELDRADAAIKETFQKVQNRKFVAFHPAYGYFADDYGLEMYALEENGKEATPKQLQDMIDLAKAENIKAIFCGAETDSRQSSAFAEEIGGEKVILDHLSDDYIPNLERMAEAVAGAMQ